MKNIGEDAYEEKLLCAYEDDNEKQVLGENKEKELCKILIRMFNWINGLEQKWDDTLRWTWKPKEWKNENEKELQAYLRCLIGRVTMMRMLGKHCDLDKVAELVYGAAQGMRGMYGIDDASGICEEVDNESIGMGGRLIWKELDQWLNQYERKKDVGYREVKAGSSALHHIKQAGETNCPPGEKGKKKEDSSNTLEFLGINGVDKDPSIKEDTKTWEKKALEEAWKEAKRVNDADELMGKMKGLEEKLEEQYGESAKKAKIVQDAAQPQGRVDSIAGDDVVLPLPSPPNPGHPGTVSGGEAGGGKSISSEAPNQEGSSSSGGSRAPAPVKTPQQEDSGNASSKGKNIHSTESSCLKGDRIPSCDDNSMYVTRTDKDEEENNYIRGNNGPEVKDIVEKDEKKEKNSVAETTTVDRDTQTPSTGTDTQTPSISVDPSQDPSASSTQGSQGSSSNSQGGPGGGGLGPRDSNTTPSPTLSGTGKGGKAPSKAPRVVEGRKYFFLRKKRKRYRRTHQVSGPPLEEQVVDHVDNQDDDPHEYTLVKGRRQPRSVQTGRTKRPKKRPAHRRPGRRAVGHRMIIDIHLEILDECQKGDTKLFQEDFFEILVQEFMGCEFIKKEEVPKDDLPKEEVPSSDSGFREEDFLPQEDVA
ncbi:SICA antigen [Plasmodium coatneyi]|uniref:SICA antigen n=1 Tax=Plasmodium coatneyi TaxID=208452 RepID=A0A1B1E1Q7_9APIC|nr:SICA antigen [Plasmodium coatneyi]ANQ08845.1 SICA antigen [Plasmodium coatneyi]